MTPSEVALKYIGQTEKPGNMGFNDASFETRMKLVGFQKSHAWCCYYVELVFKEAYPERFEELDKLFSAGTIQTFKNFRDAAYLIGNVPHENNLVIWQSYKDGKALTTGHAGIVATVQSTWEFQSVDGNTNSHGGREGFEVALQSRKILANVKTGLKLLGFIQI